jgi:competence protein ComEC
LCLLPFARLRPAAAVSCGFVLMASAAGDRLDDRLDVSLAGQTQVFPARIEEFVAADPQSLRVVVAPVGRHDLPERIRLSWLDAATVPQLGETWRFFAKLRRPRGYANPGGFDYEGWLFRQGIGAIGYVLPAPASYRINGEALPFVDRLRRAVVERLDGLLPDDEATAVLMAISVGARHRITRDQWDRYAATGTSHLMAISGLHIGLAAGSVMLLCRVLGAPFCRKRNLRDMSALAGVASALLYAALSGFAVPAQRACLMAVTACAFALARRRTGAVNLLAAPCLIIFLADPLAVLAPGFMLSFAAVAILLSAASAFVAPRSLPAPLAKAVLPFERLGYLQLALLTGLFPLTVLLFGRFTLLAPIVNILVLPVFNLLTVPAMLLGVVCVGPLTLPGDLLLELSHRSVSLALSIIGLARDVGGPGFRVAVGIPVLILAPLAHVLLPRGWPGRRFALIALAAALTYRPPAPATGCFRYHVLDVGQGLAAVVQTRRYALLFDTGPAYRSGSSAADLVVVPFLRSAGVRRLDHVVVSHADLDHAGGIAAIIRQVETGRVLAGESLAALGPVQHACIAGTGWVRDGIRFRLLHPRPDSPWTGNNASCVLEVSAGDGSLLLTGDIEAPVETLLAYRQGLRHNDVVVVPHHGSRTSSAPALVDATTPETAIVAAGYRNRWGFPKAEVVQRWRQRGAAVLNTAVSGAISQEICADGQRSPVSQYRQQRTRYWSAMSTGDRR